MDPVIEPEDQVLIRTAFPDEFLNLRIFEVICIDLCGLLVPELTTMQRSIPIYSTHSSIVRTLFWVGRIGGSSS